MEVYIKSNTITGITGWELDRLLRRSTIQNILNTISTLTSLSSLLGSLETIAVQDNIAALVNDALSSLFKVVVPRI